MTTLADTIIDQETHDRLLVEADAGPSILSAVVAHLIGSCGRDEAARILREWADAIQAERTGAPPQ